MVAVGTVIVSDFGDSYRVYRCCELVDQTVTILLKLFPGKDDAPRLTNNPISGANKPIRVGAYFISLSPFDRTNPLREGLNKKPENSRSD